MVTGGLSMTVWPGRVWVGVLLAVTISAGCGRDDGESAPRAGTAPDASVATVGPTGADDPAVPERIRTAARALQETKGRGLWAAAPSKERRELAERLFALGYLDGVRSAPSGSTSVTIHDPERAWPGVNLYVAGHAEEANLVDMDGRVLHRWTFDLETLGDRVPPDEHVSRHFFRRAVVGPNGDLLALYDNLALVKLDRDSRLLWAYTARPHHEFEVLPNGDIVALTSERRPYPPLGGTRVFTDNYLVRLAPDGTERSRVSLLEAIHHGAAPELWTALQAVLPEALGRIGDVLHANSVQTLTGRFVDRVPAFAAGNVLISLPVVHAVVVVDPRAGEVVWSLQGTFRWQHHAKLLSDGHLVLFDNQRGPEEQSAVLEIDPASGREVWAYRGTPERPFYSWCCGTCYRLPNGNTLIVETEGGRAFEVTSDGETVWEFVNPHRAGENDEFIAQLFDLVRLEPGTHRDWMRRDS